MYTIELILKSNPMPLGVMQKEEAAANELYQTLVTALQQGHPQVVELRCDKTERKLMVLTGEIAGIQMTPKAGGANATGSRTGFVAQTSEAASS